MPLHGGASGACMDVLMLQSCGPGWPVQSRLMRHGSVEVCSRAA
jgi:hypothetical protein